MLIEKNVNMNLISNDDNNGSKRLSELKKQYDINHGNVLETWSYSDPVTSEVLKDYILFLEKNSKNLFVKEFNSSSLEIRDLKVTKPYKRITVLDNGKFYSKSWRIKENFDFEKVKELYVDYDYGIITKIYKDLNSKGIALIGAEFIVDNQIVTAYGRNNSFQKAEADGLLELLERHAMYFVQKKDRRISFDRTNDEYINPQDFLYYVEQDSSQNRVPFDSKAIISWIEGENYKTKAKVWIPKQFVDLSFQNEPYFTMANSSGVALGSSRYEARLYALLELIERDAFLTYWQKNVKLREIRLQTLPNYIKNKIHDIDYNETTIHLYDMTFDIKVPCVLALIISNKGPVYQYISTAIDPNPLTAISKAMNECIVGFNIYQKNKEVKKRKYDNEYEVKTLFDHVCYSSKYKFRKNYIELLDKESYDWWQLYPKNEIGYLSNFDNPKDLLDCITEKFLANYSVHFVDLTDDLAASLGLAVYKAIIPGFSTIRFGHIHRTIVPERLDYAIDKSNYKNRTLLGRGDYVDRVHPYA